MSPRKPVNPARILLVDGDCETAKRIERLLVRDFAPDVRVERATHLPHDAKRFDAAIVWAAAGREFPDRILDLPVVVVGPGARASDCADLSQRGVQHGLSIECATCSRQPSLATTLKWAIERARILRELERARRREERTALHDALTGLPNLRSYRERLRSLLAQSRRTGKHVALLFIDMDRFKEVNDCAGHAAGDRLLRLLGQRIETSLRETDTVARRGGDEFVVLVDDVRRPNDAVRLAWKILRRISEPTVLLGTVLRPSASIGVAIAPEDARAEDALERHAELAMYLVKERGGGAVLRERNPLPGDIASDSHAPPAPRSPRPIVE